MPSEVYIRASALWLGNEEPHCAGIDATHLRGASLVTRAAIHASSIALESCNRTTRDTPIIFGSALGEIHTAVALTRSLETSTPLSPIRFKNSVHNAAPALLGIAEQSQSFATALSAGADVVAMTLLEGMSYLAKHDGHVLVVCAEETLPEPLNEFGAYAALAFACVLSATADDSYGSLTNLRCDPRSSRVAVDATHHGNPCAPVISLEKHIRERKSASLDLSVGAGPTWCIDLHCEKR